MPLVPRVCLATLFGASVLAMACGSNDNNPPGGGDGGTTTNDGGSPQDGSGPNDGGGGGDGSTDGGDDAGDATPPGPVPFNVLTQHNDIARTGENLTETTLSTANVNGQQFGKLFCRAVDDEIYTQPLIVTGVAVPGQGTHDVLYVASVNDTVYAFDANDPAATAPLWSTSFLSPGVVPPSNTDMTGACGGQYTDVSGHIGILGTPSIDLATHTMYFVARTKENGATFVQKLHAIDILDGTERANSPTEISASLPGNGSGGTTINFDPQKNNQRTSMLLVDGVLYIGFSSHCDWGPYHGWLLAYDAATLQQVAAYSPTPDGNQGGIWMAGQGPASDGKGNIYLSTANGTVGNNGDPTDTRNRGESFLRLQMTGNAFTVASWFTPFDYQRLENSDLDLGSAGHLLLPGTNYNISAGKGGTLYVVDRTTMGGLSTNRSNSNIVQSFEMAPGRHLHGAPVHWKGPGGDLIYTWAEYDHLKTFRLDPTTAKLEALPLVTSVSPAPDGMPGAMLSISASGAKDGILWANLPFKGDANQAVVPGVLRAFDAANVGHELWSSADNAARDDFGKFAKFASPTIANGKVYVATFSGQVCVYGLLPNVTPSAAPTNLTGAATSKTEAVLSWVDNSSDETGFTIERQEGNIGFASIATAPANATTYTDTTGTPFSHYQYRVRATGPVAPSAYSNVVSVVMNGGAQASRVKLFGNGRVIPNADTATTSIDGTDFSNLAVGATVSHTFTIENIGDAPLTLTGVTLQNAGPGFSLPALPAGTVASGATATFTVAFSAAAVGAQNATVAIASNDPDQPTYTFAVAGGGVGDLLAWWKLDEGAGQSIADSSGYGNNGGGNALSWIPRNGGSAAVFDGNTGYFVVPDNASLSPATTMSIAVWINPADWAGNRRVLQKGLNDSQYRLYAENNVFKFAITGVGTVQTTLPATNQWTHVAGTYDHATMRLYINGAQVASVAANAAIPDTTDTLFVGTKWDGAPPGDHFKGSLDDIRIYNRALSAGEVSTLATN